MNKLNILLISLLFFMGTSCKNKFHISQNSIIGQDPFKFVFENYSRITDTSGNFYLKFKNGDHSKIISMNQKGDLTFYGDCNELGSLINGGTQMVFRKNKLSIIRFTDSNGRISGPLFMYKKNGKLKHIFIYKNSRYVSTFYTSSSKSIKNDTFYMP